MSNNTAEIPLGRRVTKESITLVYSDGKPITVNNQHPKFEEITRKVLAAEYEGLREMCAPAQAIAAALKNNNGNGKGNGKGVEIRHGGAYYNGFPLNNAIGKKLVEEFELGHDISQYTNFVDKVMQNPSKTAVDELYLFMESGFMPLCEDGDFLAYKRIRHDYKDVHSGTLDYSPGNTVAMPRNQVDDNRDRTCSYGLHFCSFDYLHNFSGERVVMLKINPANVVSIPSDYRNTKGRACEVTVVQEVENWESNPLNGTHGNDWGTGRVERDEFSEDSYESEDDDDWEDDEDFFDDLDEEGEGIDNEDEEW